MNDLSGQIIKNYHIREQIGSGGFGEVYRAHQPKIDRNVAIKVIRAEYATQPEFRERFETEAQIIARLEHPHIVPLYDYWQDENGTFLVMRWIRGGSLKMMLKQQGGLAIWVVKRILDQLAEALTVAHEAKIIHRDLKPDNILIDDRGNTYLTDFGIAKQLDKPLDATQTGAIIGSPAYLAPEQINNGDITARTDIYSLGLVLYEMLVGQPPFTEKGLDILHRHLTTPVPSVIVSRPQLPAGFDDVIQRATAKNPDQRFQDVASFAQAFRQVAEPQQLPAVRSNIPIATVNPPSRPPRIPQNTAERNRLAILENVQRFWIEGVLENSVHAAALIELDMVQDDSQVVNPWGMVLQLPNAATEAIPSGTSIIDVFDRLNGKLLILGAPGSGKTTVLLELTRDLLERARLDSVHPIPVVFNLSSWAEKELSLENWMIEELHLKYMVPMQAGQKWLENEEILPLLDGLDEVQIDVRDDCVEAINTYREEYGFVDIVVCSRIADYEALSNKLRLDGAIVLQPLSFQQIDNYLNRSGPALQTLRTILQDDVQLQNLVASPLMLSIVSLAYHGISADAVQQFETIEDRREHIFDLYVERMLERRRAQTKYSPDETRQHLSWLAENMVNRARSIFYIEDLQPDWLDTRRERSFYALGIRFLTILGTVLYFMWCPLIFASGAVALGLINAFFAVMSLFTFYDDSSVVTPIPWNVCLSFAIPTVPLFIYGIYHERGKPFNRRWWLTLLTLALVIAGILLIPSVLLLAIPGLLYGLIANSRYSYRSSIDPVEVLQWSRPKAIRNGLIWMFWFFLIGGIFLTLGGSVIWLIEGGPDVLFDEPQIYESEIGALVDAAILYIEHFQPWRDFLLSGLMMGILGFLFGGYFGGWQSLEVDHRVRVNQGIWRSWQTAKKTFLQGGCLAYISAILVLIPMLIFVNAFYESVEFGLVMVNRTCGWPIIFGSIFFLVTLVIIMGGFGRGGYATIQHVTLRSILALSKRIPLNLARFLDHASERILLRKVGGGYIFIHRFLQEYFADLDVAEKAILSATSEITSEFTDTVQITSDEDTQDDTDFPDEATQKIDYS